MKFDSTDLARLKHAGFDFESDKNGKSKSKPTWVLGAHMDHPAFIKPPGSTPNTSTSPPLITSTALTCLSADTVVTVSGGSKYMTLMTRR